MIYQEIKVGNLLEFVESELYINSHNKPITKQRALSQYHNPRADKNDMALILAVDKDNQIIGFVGAIPESFSRNPELKIAWNSGWWVNPVKGKHVAMPLFFKFLKAWDNKVLFADMTERSKSVVMRLNQFESVRPLKGCKYFVLPRLSRILPRKYHFFSLIKPVLKLVDFFSNSAIWLGYKLKLKWQNKTDYKVKYCTEIDEEAHDFINLHNKNELFQRGQKELNWILDYPWLLKDTSKNIAASKGYYFSAVSADFRNQIVKLYSESDTLIGILFLTVNEGVVKLPYLFCDETNLPITIQFLQEFLVTEKAEALVSYHSKINNLLRQKKLPYLHKKALYREFIVGKPLLEHVNWNFDFQEGNSDVVFT